MRKDIVVNVLIQATGVADRKRPRACGCDRMGKSGECAGALDGSNRTTNVEANNADMALLLK